MKKYNEFLKDGFFNRFKKKKYIQDIFTYECVEDQFLRLKEVFGLKISISFLFEYEFYYVYINANSSKKIKNPSEEYSELVRIKNRIELMHPEIRMKINYGNPDTNGSINDIYGCWISLK